MSHGTNGSLFSWLSLTSTTIQMRELQQNYSSTTRTSTFQSFEKRNDKDAFIYAKITILTSLGVAHADAACVYWSDII